MAMNLLHQKRCSSAGWARSVRDDLLPWALAGVDLGDSTLEIGPGYGATTRALVERTAALTAVEVDQVMAERLKRLYGDRVRVVHGDGGETGLPERSFSSVVCFTMLHHVPTTSLQDRLLTEAFRVLQPGGVFAGSDRLGSPLFRLIHIRDTYNPVRSEELRDRLAQVGFVDIRVDVAGTRVRWRAFRPG